mgnify:FL=1
MKKQPKIEIRDATGKKISFKKFKAANKEELLTHAVAKKQLISNGTFTRSKLQKLVEKKELHEIVFADKIYFERDEVANCLKNLIDKKK